MLFDLSSPGRKNIIRVVYGVLALLFLVGFVGFGIGGELGSGGIIDSLTGNSGDDDVSGRYPQIEDAENKLESDPTNIKALEDLAYYRALSGSQQLEADETTGQPVLTEGARAEFESAIEAWTRYLDAETGEPDPRVAGQVLPAYVFLGDSGGAASIQEILAKEQPTFENFARLAAYYFDDGDLKRGDDALKKAEAEAKPNERPVLKQLDQIRAAAVKEKKQAGKQDAPAPGENPLTDPLGEGLGAPTAP